MSSNWHHETFRSLAMDLTLASIMSRMQLSTSSLTAAEFRGREQLTRLVSSARAYLTAWESRGWLRWRVHSRHAVYAGHPHNLPQPQLMPAHTSLSATRPSGPCMVHCRAQRPLLYLLVVGMNPLAEAPGASSCCLDRQRLHTRIAETVTSIRQHCP